jgi:hypothetical protein
MPLPNAHFNSSAASTSSAIQLSLLGGGSLWGRCFSSRIRPSGLTCRIDGQWLPFSRFSLLDFYWLLAALQVREQSILSLASSYPPVVDLSSKQDHQQTMDLLHMASIRRGRDRSLGSRYAAN